MPSLSHHVYHLVRSRWCSDQLMACLRVPRLSGTRQPSLFYVCQFYDRFRRHYATNVQPHAEENLENAPLYGIRVLDLTRVLAGPLCTMVLGDMGAEIIKIERPGTKGNGELVYHVKIQDDARTGDETRNWGPPFIGSESCYFLSVNRNKKSVAVDIAATEGSRIVQQLAEKCDIFIHNFLPGKLDEYGLGYGNIHKRNPGIVYCSISGYGEDGPYRERGGYDVIASAIGGMMHITGPEDGEPCKIGTAMTDISTGLYANGAILAALLRRQRTGLGAKIECNLLATQVANLVNLSANFLNTGKEPKRWGTAHESIVPYQAFKTKDNEYLVVGAGSDLQFTSLCRLMDLDYSTNPKFATNSVRVKHRQELIGLLSAEFDRKSLNEWLGVFKTAKFPYGPVNSFARTFLDPQVKHLNMVFDMEHEKAGTVRLVKSPVKVGDYSMPARLPPPMLGQHTDSVLKEMLDYDEENLKNLRQKLVIQ